MSLDRGSATATAARRAGSRDDNGGDGAGPRRRRTRRPWVLAGIVVLAGAVAAAAVVVARGDGGGGAGGGEDPPAATTVAIEQRDLVLGDVFEGELGFGTADAVTAGRGGVVTGVTPAGTVVGPGGVLFHLDLQPAVLLRGGIPAFRDLSVDADPGADIRQLEQALVELGYGSGITVDTTFTRATARAVTAWEKALGRPGPDGVVTRGDVVFAPSDLRLAAVIADLGTQVEAGDDVVEVTATAKVVTLPLSEDQVATIEAGMPATVTLPDEQSAPGKITAVASEPTTVEDDEGNPLEVFPVTVALDDPALASAFDSGSVEIRVDHGGVEAAIAVPVVALVALSEGGYGLQVAEATEPAGYRLVPVEVGTIAEDWAEVSGDGIEAGVEVVVPK